MAEDVLIPLIVFTAITIMTVAGFAFSHQKRRTVYDTIRVAIEKSGTADPKLIEALIRDNVGPYSDLRRGIILIAVAIAFAILGYAVDEQDAVGPMLGLAYISFHFFAPREPTV